jgi:hypothetical protein
MLTIGTNPLLDAHCWNPRRFSMLTVGTHAASRCSLCLSSLHQVGLDASGGGGGAAGATASLPELMDEMFHNVTAAVTGELQVSHCLTLAQRHCRS